MTVVFDMDNTLVDSFGGEVRPGIVALLERLRGDGHVLVLWTNSRRERALEILGIHDLRRQFASCICREDYDPHERDVPKDIRRVRGDMLVDDDPDAVAYVRSTGRRGYCIRPFHRGAGLDRAELARLYTGISRSPGLLERLRHRRSPAAARFP